MMDVFLWWSGVVAWLALAFVGFLAGGDKVIDWTLNSLNAKRLFLEFVWEKLKSKRDGKVT